MIDLDRIDAIDVHVHAWAPGAADEDPMLVQAAKYFGDVQPPASLDAMAGYYRERRMACVVFTVDGKNQTKAHVTNDEVLAFAERNDDIVIPFVSVDPTRGTAGVREAERLIETGRVRGFKLHPQTQGFFANDPAYYPFYEVIEAAKLPVIVHTGHSGMGTGMRGGGGIRLKYGNPMLLDGCARMKRSRSVCTNRKCTSISPAGRRNTFRRTSCNTRTPSSSTRCSSARTTRCSLPTVGYATSPRSRSKTKSAP